MHLKMLAKILVKMYNKIEKSISILESYGLNNLLKSVNNERKEEEIKR